jgi:2-succinyl-5-enolpyruvyl-6-hydroxy-3-cyclohexene-1-carboxylate synthase
LSSAKEHIKNLVDICYEKGLRNIVISPGSRNAPLTIAFNRHKKINCLSIIDERSAAFFALGMAQQLGEPVAVVCTSGTAALNYAPAIAEAYYQKIPLIILTADRPAEWIDQVDGQTIRQQNIFSNYIKKSFQLPQEPSHADDFWYASRIVSEAIETAKFPEFGPIHINIPLREPLYQIKEYPEKTYKTFETVTTQLSLPNTAVKQLTKEWKKAKKILIITGLLKPNEKINSSLNKIAEQNKVVVLTETTSNLFGENFNRSIDRLIISIEDEGPEDFIPDLLITIGGPIVSAKVKTFFRKNQPKKHWHINASNDYVDTFKCLTRIIPVAPEQILPHFEIASATPSNYRELWINKDKKLFGIFRKFLDEIPFCDLKAFDLILNAVPKKTDVQLSNSTPVRYSNLFNTFAKRNLFGYGNRGTSGIDGTISTAAGAAYASKKLTTVITGDLSFFYDSNALMNQHLPNNLRIVIINNGGGNIFRIIDGPGQTEELEQFFETKHNWSAEHIAKAFGVDFYLCKDAENLSKTLEKIYAPQYKKCCVVEIKTKGDLNSEILLRYFDYLKKN